MQIQSKVYFLIKTGEVLLITPETESDITQTTQEEDMKRYKQLQNINVTEVDYILLKYGTLFSILTNAKSYIVNINTRKLEVKYYTQEEIEAMKSPSSKEDSLKERADLIANYFYLKGDSSISEAENFIIQSELSKLY